MKALVKTTAAAGLSYVDVPEPTMGREDVRIRVLRTGICGTDVHIHRWDGWAQRTLTLPRVVGHEFVGEIVEVGAGVGALRPGQLVGAEAHLTCERCAHCRAGARHLCTGTQGLGVQRDGVFAEFITLPARSIWVHAPGISLDVAAIFDPFGNAVHAADTFDLDGRTVLITGAGPIGALTAAVAVHRGARLVAVTDVNPFRLKLAQTLGAHHAVEAAPGAVSRLLADLGRDTGFDVAFEMSGNPQALHETLSCVDRGGHVGLLGLPPEPVPADWADLSLHMITVHGISGRRVFDTWHSMRDLLRDGLDPQPVITHHFPADEHDEAFAAAAEGSAGKVVLTWSEPTGATA
ncbi:L-threonine 3-dehydrogenase [Streptomyces sp. NPDC001880]